MKVLHITCKANAQKIPQGLAIFSIISTYLLRCALAVTILLSLIIVLGDELVRASVHVRLEWKALGPSLNPT